MKPALLFLVGILFASLSLPAQDGKAYARYNLVASRQGARTLYRPETRLLIQYQDGSTTRKIRGVFAGGTQDSIVVRTGGGRRGLVFIPVSGISYIRKIHPRERIVLGVIGTLFVGGGSALLGSSGNSPGSALRAAFVIPVIGIGTYLLLAEPVTLLLERLNEKKREHGWQFELSGS